jgi:hypothetical protein
MGFLLEVCLEFLALVVEPMVQSMMGSRHVLESPWGKGKAVKSWLLVGEVY